MNDIDFKPKNLQEAIEIAKEILLMECSVDLFPDWSKEDLKILNLPDGELQDLMTLLHSSKNEYTYTLRIEPETRMWELWQHQDIGIATYNHCIHIDHDLNIY